MDIPCITLLVPRALVKRVKSVLESRNLLEKRIKIIVEDEEQGVNGPRMRIPTTLFLPSDLGNVAEDVIEGNIPNGQKESIMRQLGLEGLNEDIAISVSHPLTSNNVLSSRNPLLKALAIALQDLPESLLESLHITSSDLVDSFPTTYSIYKPMLLLPPNSFSSPPWTKLLSAYPPTSPTLTPLWKRVASSVNTTHIALNSGIPPSTTASKSPSDPTSSKPNDQENILRSPLNLTPTHGSFGPPPNQQRKTNPTQQDFDAAFWVSTCQNGIFQTWAPLYTMFSRGNIREKTRLQTLPSVQSAVSDGNRETKLNDPQNASDEYRSGCAAVDLYAGIGYFAFSYKRAGISTVLCWELNPWSVEGLKRGAAMNGWTSHTFLPSSGLRSDTDWTGWWQRQLSGNGEKDVRNVDFLIFEESNENAMKVIAQLRSETNVDFPRIRHVNCGFLPSSCLSWNTAVRALDPRLGGWIHVHENVGADDIEARKGEIERVMQRYSHEWEAENGHRADFDKRVRCVHAERVKTYAPGVVHVVFDVHVEGMRDVERVLMRGE